MKHAAHHALVAVGLYKAGEALTVRRRLAWLALAAGAVHACHIHHHRRSQ